MSRIAYFVGIDAGTSSVRAAVFDEAGQIQGISVVPVKIYEGGGHYEQSSSAIWQSCCQAVKTAILSSKVELGAIKGAVFYAGFGISATASLVALDAEYKPVSVSADNDDSKNTIMWYQHFEIGWIIVPLTRLYAHLPRLVTFLRGIADQSALNFLRQKSFGYMKNLQTGHAWRICFVYQII